MAVDGGMSDNLRPMLYGAPYEALVANRVRWRPAASACNLAGKHCESGDVIVRDVALADPAPGDVVVTPVTGAYGYSLANNYNSVPRPPVIFCREGDARVVVRRETYDDLAGRDVEMSAQVPGRAARARHGRLGVRARCCPSTPIGSSGSPGCGPSCRGSMTRSRGLVR